MPNKACPKCKRDVCISHAANVAHDLMQHATRPGVWDPERDALRVLCDLVDAIEDRPADFWKMLTSEQRLALLQAYRNAE